MSKNIANPAFWKHKGVAKFKRITIKEIETGKVILTEINKTFYDNVVKYLKSLCKKA